MSTQIIEANPKHSREIVLGPKDQERERGKKEILQVAEFFYDTIQGEGISTGVPAAFLRLKGCTLDCIWCDSTEVWKEGNPYTIKEMVEKIAKTDLPEKLKKGHHLILTGGSPLKQQEALVTFIEEFRIRFGFRPYTEIENEGVLVPIPKIISFIHQWNNSVKLSNSGMKERARYKPEIIKQLSSLNNSWFKFVVEKEEDWQEIERDFLIPKLIKREQIIIMPCGSNQEELSKTREIVAKLAVEKSVRFSDRLHVTIWDKKTGV